MAAEGPVALAAVYRSAIVAYFDWPAANQEQGGD